LVCRRCGVDGDAAFDRISAQATSGAGGEQRIVWSTSALGQPGVKKCLGRFGERDGSLLASLAFFAAHVRPGAEHNVAAVERDELGDA
jgi:hypothetical protein